jgi:hypothetical protein
VPDEKSLIFGKLLTDNDLTKDSGKLKGRQTFADLFMVF